MIKNLNKKCLIIITIFLSVLFFCGIIFSFITPTIVKADENVKPSFERVDKSKSVAQNLAENAQFVGFSKVDYFGFDDQRGIAISVYVSLDFLCYEDNTNQYGYSHYLYGDKFLYGFFYCSSSVFNEYGLTGDYLDQAKKLNLISTDQNYLFEVDSPSSLTEIFNFTNGGAYACQRIKVSEENRSTQLCFIPFFYDIATETRYYMDPHFATYDLLSTNNDIIDLSRYISIEESNEIIKLKDSEISKLKTEIESLKKTSLKSNSNNILPFFVFALPFAIFLVLVCVFGHKKKKS